MSDEQQQPEPEPCNCEPGAPKWMVTFGDMMSLLLCFFVLLLSFSTVDVIKYRQLTGSMKDAFGIAKTDPDYQIPSADKMVAVTIQPPQVLSNLVTVRAKARRKAKSSSEMEMESGADWVRIKIDGDALFQSGTFQLTPAAFPLLDEVAVMANDFAGTIMIEGHTDNDLYRNTRFSSDSVDLGNYELGAMRSIAVLNYMVENRGVSPNKLIPLSFGSKKPRETNDRTEGKARNRRVEFEFRASSDAHNEDVGGKVLGSNDE